MDLMTDNTKCKIKTTWAELAQTKSIHNYDMAAYMIIKAMFSKSNDTLEIAKALLLKAFSPVSSYTKLNNGRQPFDCLVESIRSVRWSKLTDQLDDQQRTAFMSLCTQLSKEKWVDPVFCYIFTRTDIPAIHQLVQTSHATMVAGQCYPMFDAKNIHFCILQGGNNDELCQIGMSLKMRKIDFATFNEPDSAILWNGQANGEVTSIVCKPMRRSKAIRKRFFLDKPLLTI